MSTERLCPEFTRHAPDKEFRRFAQMNATAAEGGLDNMGINEFGEIADGGRAPDPAFSRLLYVPRDATEESDASCDEDYSKEPILYHRLSFDRASSTFF